ncbi:EAL domain-containing protein [Synechocystis sp. B12]|nr:EAL domain-containing protein [Synechocystis sp. B12]
MLINPTISSQNPITAMNPSNAQLTARRYRAGDPIFSEGDQGNFAYIIEEGQVEIWTELHGDRRVLNVLQPGSLFGELALVDAKPRSASASALTDCILSLVTPDQVNQRIDTADPILRLLLLVVIGHFRSESNNFRGTTEPALVLDAALTKTKLSLKERITDAVDMIRLEGEMKEAIAKEQFHLVYQPIVFMDDLRIEGFEALIRWQSPKRGFVRPDRFIEVAEATDLIIPIGQWVIEQGLKDLKTFQTKFNPNLLMSFNIVGRQTNSEDFVPWLLEKVDHYGLTPDKVKLEIIERTLFSGESSAPWIENCRSQGFALVLDDFGTGYSSLQYLNEYKIDRVKIDKSFVDGLGTNQNSESICSAILQLSHALGMTVVAEGIETQAQLEILQSLGCDYGQGYLFSRPLRFDQVMVLDQDAFR